MLMITQETEKVRRFFIVIRKMLNLYWPGQSNWAIDSTVPSSVGLVWAVTLLFVYREKCPEYSFLPSVESFLSSKLKQLDTKTKSMIMYKKH